MIRVKIEMEDEEGHQIEVYREYTGSLTGKNLDEIEHFVCQVKAETMEASELSLLNLNQELYSKKK
jgi:hypothetical protein